jgi:hypothetical protein
LREIRATVIACTLASGSLAASRSPSNSTVIAMRLITALDALQDRGS